MCCEDAAKRGGGGGHALKSHGNYSVGHGKSWKNHEIRFLNFCGNPEITNFNMLADDLALYVCQI